MPIKDQLHVFRVQDEAGRAAALEVIRATYRDEKGWVQDEAPQLPAEDLTRPEVSWFVVQHQGQPIGVLRVLYDPPLEIYAQYGFQLLDREIDVAAFLRSHRIAEVGRFAVVPEYRKHILAVAALIREAITETVARGYTHYITDVFEDDPHSPYEFHTRVLGFAPVATHEVGELNCRSRRITMVLDIKQAYDRLKAAHNWIYRFITEYWDERHHNRLMV